MRRRKGDLDVVGIDLSLRRAAAVRVPADWQPGEWSRVGWDVFDGGLVERGDWRAASDRAYRLAEALTEFVCNRFLRPLPRVFVEDAVGGLAARSGIELAELAGAVKAMVRHQLDVVVQPVNVATARKLFLGKIPRGKGAAPAAVHSALAALGCPWEGSDQGDAFLVANFGRTELGLPGVSIG